MMDKAYEDETRYIYDGDERILIEYDTFWKTSTAYNDEGDEEDLTMFFEEVPTLKSFERIAKQILIDNPYLLKR
jgi:hypothetical protein